MKLGARVLKTGVAIVFALSLAELLNLPSPVFAGIAAIFAIQPSIYRSYLTILEQIQGNLIGASVAVIFSLIFGHHLVAIGIAAIIVIGLMIRFNLEKSLTLALVTVVAIMEIQGDDFCRSHCNLLCLRKHIRLQYPCNSRLRACFVLGH